MQIDLPIPQSVEQLYYRAQCLAGCSIQKLAEKLNVDAPVDLRRDKGWVGILIERYLGANAGNKAERDFAHLGIELKTIPIGRNGKPLETTFVCSASLKGNVGCCWEESHVRYKLACVLWIPVEGDRTIPLLMRRIGYPVLWRPSQKEEALLQQDWEEIMENIALGGVHTLSARQGQVMQMRPKAANSRVSTEAIGETGKSILTNPRGFYLKKAFTYHILMQHNKTANDNNKQL